MQHPSQPLQPEQQRRSRRRLWLVLSIVALVLASSVGAYLFATHASTSASTTSVTQQTAIPTQLPTPTLASTQQAGVLPQSPTQTPTSTPVPTMGAAILGGNILAFSAKYGTPDSDSNGSVDSQTTGHYGFLNHAFDVVTQGSRVVSIVANEPDTATWSLKEAESICYAFVPPDSIYKQSATVLDAQKNPGLQMVFYSSSLSKQPFPASYLKDQNGNPVTPGTLGILFVYDASDTSQVGSCIVW